MVRRSRASCAALLLVALGLGFAPHTTPADARSTARPTAHPSAAGKTPSRAAATKRVAKNAHTRVVAKKKQTGWHPHSGNAPADEYFGRLGMSILGVRNKVKDLGLDADLHPDHDVAILSTALWVEDAMRDWAKKYPYDRWLPRYAFALEEMYEEIPGDNAHKRALKQLGYITAYFPTTVYGRVGRAKLAMGVPAPDRDDPPVVVQTDLQRLALLDGKVLPTLPPAPTPTPAAAPSPTPSPAAEEQTTPALALPSATPAPQPVHTARPIR